MTDLVALHETYDPRSALFTDRDAAEQVATHLYALLSKKLPFVTWGQFIVGGKKGLYWVEMPRIKMIWQPKFARAVDIAEELATAATLFAQTQE